MWVLLLYTYEWKDNLPMQKYKSKNTENNSKRTQESEFLDPALRERVRDGCGKT